jgi:hypothetical protein
MLSRGEKYYQTEPEFIMYIVGLNVIIWLSAWSIPAWSSHKYICYVIKWRYDVIFMHNVCLEKPPSAKYYFSETYNCFHTILTFCLGFIKIRAK